MTVAWFWGISLRICDCNRPCSWTELHMEKSGLEPVPPVLRPLPIHHVNVIHNLKYWRLLCSCVRQSEANFILGRFDNGKIKNSRDQTVKRGHGAHSSRSLEASREWGEETKRPLQWFSPTVFCHTLFIYCHWLMPRGLLVDDFIPSLHHHRSERRCTKCLRALGSDNNHGAASLNVMLVSQRYHCNSAVK